MAKRRKVKATFSDGQAITRTSKDRVYTHAWRYIATKDGTTWPRAGYSTSAAQARINADRESSWTRKKGVSGWTLAIEVVEVEVL